jgi:hypothetical protein
MLMTVIMVVDAVIVVVSVTVIKCGFSGGRDLNSDCTARG